MVSALFSTASSPDDSIRVAGAVTALSGGAAVLLPDVRALLSAALCLKGVNSVLVEAWACFASSCTASGCCCSKATTRCCSLIRAAGGSAATGSVFGLLESVAVLALP